MITIVMGRPGVGKSTYLALMARKALKKGIKVYSNYHILGCYKIDPNFDFGNILLENGLIIVDEAGREHNSRDWQRFTRECYTFYSQHRHYNLDIILAVQHWERLDLTIKELVQEIHIVKNTILPGFIKIKKVFCDIDIINHKIEEIYEYISILVGGTRYHLAKPAWRMFDSWERDMSLVTREFYKWGELPKKEGIFHRVKSKVTKYYQLYFRSPEGGN